MLNQWQFKWIKLTTKKIDGFTYNFPSVTNYFNFYCMSFPNTNKDDDNVSSRCDSRRCSQLSKLSRQVPEQPQKDEDNTRRPWNSAGHRVHRLWRRVPCLLSLWLLEDPRRRRDNLDGEDLRLLLADQDHQQHQRRQAWVQDQRQGSKDWLESHLAWRDSRCLNENLVL